MIELLIANIDKLDSEFFTYKAGSMKLLLLNTLEYIEQEEEECERLREWQTANEPTEICKTCTTKSVEDMYKYKQALDEIEENIKEYCKNMCMADTRETCEICQNTEVLDIIRKTECKK